eukprot:403343521
MTNNISQIVVQNSAQRDYSNSDLHGILLSSDSKDNKNNDIDIGNQQIIINDYLTQQLNSRGGEDGGGKRPNNNNNNHHSEFNQTNLQLKYHNLQNQERYLSVNKNRHESNTKEESTNKLKENQSNVSPPLNGSISQVTNASQRYKKQQQQYAQQQQNYNKSMSLGVQQQPIYKISPEKKYINSRLNIKMFYSEQLSVKPLEQTLEDDLMKNGGQTIKDIIMNQIKQESNNYTSITVPYTEAQITERNKHVINILHASRSDTAGALDQDQLTRNSNKFLMDSKLDNYNSITPSQMTKNPHYSYKNNVVNSLSQQEIRELKNPRLRQKQTLSHMSRYVLDQKPYPDIEFNHLTSINNLSNQSEMYDQSQVDTNQNSLQSLNQSQAYPQNLNQKTNPLILARKNNNFVNTGKALMRKNYELSRDPILQNPYKQLASSFVLANRDRFGEPYVPLRPQNQIPGPGYYQIPEKAKINNGANQLVKYQQQVLSRSKLQVYQNISKSKSQQI